VVTLKAPSATWTYLVNDKPYEDKFAMQLIGDIGFSALAGLQFPLIVLYVAVRKYVKRRTARLRQKG
jgi:hypothetical protein